MNTSTTWTNTVWYTITKNASNTIEIDWQAATTPSGNNGLLTFWVNGVQRDNKTGLRNGNRAVDTVQWGMVTGRDTGTSGAFYLDGFVSRRATYIGSQSTGQMAVGPVFDLAAKSYYRPVRLDGLKDRAAAGLAAPLADISGTVLVTTTIGYQYDGLGRLIAARYSDGRFFEYTYDSTGNRLSETKPTGSLTYTYDVANRLIAAGAQTYVWDAAGNLITDSAITYTYDSAQRLIGLEIPGSTSSYVYNGLGDRVQQSVNGATTNYALDLNTGLTQVLADTGTVYLYGADRLGEQQAGGWQYHHADGLGSLRTLTNGSATVTLSKRYAPYGDVLDMAGTGASIFGFTGEQQNEGLVYLRARYYASGLGRFVSRDTWQGEYNRGLSLNRWTYVEANPMGWTDPSGQTPHCRGGYCGPDVTRWLAGEMGKHFAYGRRQAAEYRRMETRAELMSVGLGGCYAGGILPSILQVTDRGSDYNYIAQNFTLQGVPFGDLPATSRRQSITAGVVIGLPIALVIPAIGSAVGTLIAAGGSTIYWFSWLEYAVYGLAIDYANVRFVPTSSQNRSCSTPGCGTIKVHNADGTVSDHQVVSMCGKCIDGSDIGNLMFGLGGAARGFGLGESVGAAMAYNGLADDPSGLLDALDKMINSPDGRGAAPGWIIGATGAYRSPTSMCQILKALQWVGYNDNVDQFRHCQACGAAGMPRLVNPPSPSHFVSGDSYKTNPVTELEDKLSPMTP